jgi:hypothetical protein
MFLVEIIDSKAARDRRVHAVGFGDVIVERDADENVQPLCDFGDFGEHRAVVAQNTRSALVSRIDKQNER